MYNLNLNSSAAGQRETFDGVVRSLRALRPEEFDSVVANRIFARLDLGASKCYRIGPAGHPFGEALQEELPFEQNLAFRHPTKGLLSSEYLDITHDIITGYHTRTLTREYAEIYEFGELTFSLSPQGRGAVCVANGLGMTLGYPVKQLQPADLAAIISAFHLGGEPLLNYLEEFSGGCPTELSSPPGFWLRPAPACAPLILDRNGEPDYYLYEQVGALCAANLRCSSTPEASLTDPEARTKALPSRFRCLDPAKGLCEVAFDPVRDRESDGVQSNAAHRTEIVFTLDREGVQSIALDYEHGAGGRRRVMFDASELVIGDDRLGEIFQAVPAAAALLRTGLTVEDTELYRMLCDDWGCTSAPQQDDVPAGRQTKPGKVASVRELLRRCRND
jgi:hypothetical protein